MKAAIKRLYDTINTGTTPGAETGQGKDLPAIQGVVTSLHPAADVTRTVRMGVISLLAVFGGLGIWAIFAPLSGAVIGQGLLKLDTNRKTVQHLEGGIVKEIRVRDGDYVRAGQTLIVIEDENVSADVDMLQGQLDTLLIKSVRLDAERDRETELVFPHALAGRINSPDIAKLIQGETTYFNSRLQSLNTQILLLQGQAEEAENELEGFNSQIAATRSALGYLQQQVDATEELEKLKYAQMSELLTLKRGIEDYKIQLGEYVSEVSRTRQKILDLNLRIEMLRNEYTEAAAEELTSVNASIHDLRERIRPSLDARRRQNILAPVDGTVVDMKVFTVGGIISPRDKLMDIVQEDEMLIVETRIPVDSIDSVSAGQSADIRLSAYSSRNTPLVAGTVTYVSADRLVDERSGEAYYLTHVNLDRESLAEAGDAIELYPGMPAEVFIATGKRTAMDYLLAPVTDTLRRSAREP